MRHSLMYRYPHGYYDGGLVRTAICPTITISSFEANNFIAEIKDNDMRQRDFHRQCRVIYRAMRKQYGKEKVQDECLRVFKVLFPEMLKAKHSEDKYYQLSDVGYNRLEAILTEWIPEEGALRDVICHALNEFDRVMEREEFITFCEDCMPVVMRIRKLSNRECYRLQGVSEKDIDTLLASGISKSAHFKLAGNSITAGGNHCDKDGNWDGPLFNLFRKLFIETGPDVVKGEVTQLSLW